MSDYNKMEAIEFSDKTVDKAIEAACDHFNCTREDLELEIITRGSTGLFGLGGRKARIKVKPLKKIPPEGNTDVVINEAPAAETSLEGIQEPDREQDEASTAPITEKKHLQETEAGQVSPPERQAWNRKGQEIPPDLIAKQVAAACDITNGILKKSGLEGEASLVQQSSGPSINISGRDLSLIIGKEGKTLDALEYLVNLCLKRKDHEISYRVQLDAGGYRERRKKSLTSLAERLAHKAKKTGKPVSFQPMTARERRIIHIALRNVRGIKTHSAGEGGGRKVVITPYRRKKRQGKNRNHSR